MKAIPIAMPSSQPTASLFSARRGRPLKAGPGQPSKLKQDPKEDTVPGRLSLQCSAMREHAFAPAAAVVRCALIT